MRWIFARLIYVAVDEFEDKSVVAKENGSAKKEKEKAIRRIEVSDQDIVPFDLEGIRMARLRGEIAREVLELFIETMDATPKRPNLAYLLFGFDLDSFQLTKTIGFGRFICLNLFALIQSSF